MPTANQTLLGSIAQTLAQNKFTGVALETPFGFGSVWQHKRLRTYVEVYDHLAEDRPMAKPEVWVCLKGEPVAIRVSLQPFTNTSQRLVNIINALNGAR